MVSDEVEPVALGSGEAEPALRGWARRSLWPWCRARWSQPSGVGRGRAYGLSFGRGGANPQGLGEAEFKHLGVGWSCSRALDCLDESMLMVISSSSSGTLVLVPNTLIHESPFL